MNSPSLPLIALPMAGCLPTASLRDRVEVESGFEECAGRGTTVKEIEVEEAGGEGPGITEASAPKTEATATEIMAVDRKKTRP